MSSKWYKAWPSHLGVSPNRNQAPGTVGFLLVSDLPTKRETLIWVCLLGDPNLLLSVFGFPYQRFVARRSIESQAGTGSPFCGQ